MAETVRKTALDRQYKERHNKTGTEHERSTGLKKEMDHLFQTNCHQMVHIRNLHRR